jgi:hypothetical protein
MRAALVFFALLAGCSSCKKNDELAHDSGFNPTSDASSPAFDAAPPPPLFTPRERRDLKIRIGNEDCEKAAKRINTLHNRPETDIKGIEILSLCLKAGNMAWYRCVLDASGPDDADTCAKRFLQQ